MNIAQTPEAYLAQSKNYQRMALSLIQSGMSDREKLLAGKMWALAFACRRRAKELSGELPVPTDEEIANDPTLIPQAQRVRDEGKTSELTAERLLSLDGPLSTVNKIEIATFLSLAYLSSLTGKKLDELEELLQTDGVSE